MPPSPLTALISDHRDAVLESAASIADAHAEASATLAQNYVRSPSLFAQHAQAELVARKIAKTIRALKDGG